MKSIARLALATVISLTSFAALQAEQYVVPTPQGTKVAHTRIAPVVVHRAFPPYAGQHVYRRR
jgi:hypothetical protein